MATALLGANSQAGMERSGMRRGRERDLVTESLDGTFYLWYETVLFIKSIMRHSPRSRLVVSGVLRR